MHHPPFPVPGELFFSFLTTAKRQSSSSEACLPGRRRSHRTPSLSLPPVLKCWSHVALDFWREVGSDV